MVPTLLWLIGGKQHVLSNPVTEEQATGLDSSANKRRWNSSVKSFYAIGDYALPEAIKSAGVEGRIMERLGLQADFDSIKWVFKGFA